MEKLQRLMVKLMLYNNLLICDFYKLFCSIRNIFQFTFAVLEVKENINNHLLQKKILRWHFSITIFPKSLILYANCML